MDQKSLDIGDECYRAALRHGLPCPFLCNCFVVPIYPDPELSSKDSASVVYCCSMGVCYFRVRMACVGFYIFASPFWLASAIV